MNISSVNSYKPVVTYSKKANLKTDFEAENTFFNILSTTNVAETKISQNNSLNIWEELSRKYDIRNATYDEVKDISLSLYNAREISLKEHSILTFDFDRASKDIIRNSSNLGIQVSPNFSMYETVANGNGERDWIAEYEARVETDYKFGNLIGYQNKQKVLNILSRLDANE